MVNKVDHIRATPGKHFRDVRRSQRFSVTAYFVSELCAARVLPEAYEEATMTSCIVRTSPAFTEDRRYPNAALDCNLFRNDDTREKMYFWKGSLPLRLSEMDVTIA